MYACMYVCMFTYRNIRAVLAFSRQITQATILAAQVAQTVKRSISAPYMCVSCSNYKFLSALIKKHRAMVRTSNDHISNCDHGLAAKLRLVRVCAHAFHE